MAGQIFIFFEFDSQNRTRYDYDYLMYKINTRIYNNSLDRSYETTFENIFNRYWDNGSWVKGAILFWVMILQIILGIYSLFGVIFNIVILFTNKRNLVSIVLFSYVLLMGLIELYCTLFNENSTSISFTSREREAFKDIMEDIEKNLYLVKKRVLLLRIFSALVIVTSIIHIYLSFLINKIVTKLHMEDILRNSGEENINNSPLDKNLIDIR